MVLSPGSPASVLGRLSPHVPAQEERQPLPRSRVFREASVPSGRWCIRDPGCTLGASAIWSLAPHERLPEILVVPRVETSINPYGASQVALVVKNLPAPSKPCVHLHTPVYTTSPFLSLFQLNTS